MPAADPLTTVVTAAGAVVVPGALILGAALAGSGTRRRPGLLTVLAGIVLLALVAVDLVPDLLEESAGLGAAQPLVVVPVLLVFAVGSRLLGRPGALRCCSGRSGATGLVAAAALAAHGLLEGYAAGLGTGVGAPAAAGLLALFAAHRGAEGVALRAALQPLARGPRWAWIAIAAVTPLAGGDLGLRTEPGPVLSVATTIVLVGLLGAAGARLIREDRAATTADQPVGVPVAAPR